MTKVDFGNKNFHKSVLLREVLGHLNPKDGETYLDATFGAGGYSQAILESSNCNLFAIDCDEMAKNFADKISEKYGSRFKFLSGKFSDCDILLEKEGIFELDAMIFDIGVSSMQLDDKTRGFSFDSDDKLDMRMDKNSSPSAFEVVNEFSEKELANIIKEFGEEPKAKIIARKIIEQRKSKPITSCRDLSNIVRSFYAGYFKTDPATRTFQAIRIFVNQELEQLKIALKKSLSLLKDGGRLIVVSFHSLEDKIVKSFLKEESGQSQTFSRYQPQDLQNQKHNFKIINKSAISPKADEVDQNLRSRSAKMRVAVRKRGEL
jgi:16S rRNA (cytosine1402-N4)-methyltransferase